MGWETYLTQADQLERSYQSKERPRIQAETEARRHELVDAIRAAMAAGDRNAAAGILNGFYSPLLNTDQGETATALLAELLTTDNQPGDGKRLFGLHEHAYTDAFLKGRTEEAEAHCARLFEIAAETDSDALLARAYTARCRLGLRREDGPAVESDAKELGVVADRVNDDFLRAFSAHMLANLREMQGDTRAAVDHYQESTRLFDRAGAHRMTMVEAFNLAACEMDLDHLEAARAGFGRCIGLMEEMRDDHLAPELLSCTANLLLKEGDAERAVLLVGASDTALERAGRVLYPAEEKVALEMRAKLEAELGRDAYEIGLTRGRSLSFGEARSAAGLG